MPELASDARNTPAEPTSATSTLRWRGAVSRWAFNMSLRPAMPIYLDEGGMDFFVLEEVSHEGLRARQLVAEILGLCGEPLVLIGDGQLHSGGLQALRDAPRNRALVGDSKDNRRPAFQLKGH